MSVADPAGRYEQLPLFGGKPVVAGRANASGGRKASCVEAKKRTVTRKKLTDHQVQVILQLHGDPRAGIGTRELARLYGVSRALIRMIVKHERRSDRPWMKDRDLLRMANKLMAHFKPPEAEGNAGRKTRWRKPTRGQNHAED